jgi:hypothetical protein
VELDKARHGVKMRVALAPARLERRLLALAQLEPVIAMNIAAAF